MSDVKVIVALLLADAAVRSMVRDEIHPGVVPQGTVLPAIAINSISNFELGKIKDAGNYILKRSRTQVTVETKSYEDQKTLLRLVSLAIRDGKRQVAGVLVNSIARDTEGPDMRNDDAGIFMQSRDFRVTYNEPLF
jgi:hypothetical protein